MDENIIVIEFDKFNLMKILKRHYKLDQLLTSLFDSKEVTIQGYNAEEV